MATDGLEYNEPIILFFELKFWSIFRSIIIGFVCYHLVLRLN